ncbi:TniQ protein [Paenibacillus sp. 1_12]|uniref:TniQ family protein n=1 Tax=Paenibacillus sp. 1_12 TaxID=1566278 RepID=UPI0008E289A1|nr:TniQ family protein [Paenibacillus sp. 1_12]SFL28064.1 TniQ protein [Paenibacillus sp. 1_12]
MQYCEENRFFVKRVEPNEGESLRGLILRVSELNKCEPDSKIVYRRSGLQKYNQFNNILIPHIELDLRKLSLLMRLDQVNLNNMVLINQLGQIKFSDEKIRFHLWRNATCATKQRFCPLCFKEHGFHKSIWEVSLYTVCHEHGCLMVDFCNGYGGRINPYRQRLMSCKCGFNFTKSEVVKSSSVFSEYFARRFHYRERSNSDFSIIDQLEIFQLIYLMIISTKWINGSQYAFIQEKLDYYLLNYWKDDYEKEVGINNLSYKKISTKIYAMTIRDKNEIPKNGISKKEVSELLGVGLDQVDFLREKHIIKPISGPTINGGQLWLFLFSPLEALDSTPLNQIQYE